MISNRDMGLWRVMGILMGELTAMGIEHSGVRHDPQQPAILFALVDGVEAIPFVPKVFKGFIVQTILSSQEDRELVAL